MRVVVGSDQRAYVADMVVEELQSRCIEVELYGALKEGDYTQWADVARRVSERVSGGACQHGILLCWTGTGVSMASNKVPGARAALCIDAETARGARRYNDANILCMSLRLTSPHVAREMLDAWFSTVEIDETERQNIEFVREMDNLRRSGLSR
jgi:ribose 5-phosphate isomerase B